MSEKPSWTVEQKKQWVIYCLTAGFAIMSGVLYWAAKQGILPIFAVIGIMVAVLIADFFAAKKMFEIIDAQAD